MRHQTRHSKAKSTVSQKTDKHGDWLGRDTCTDTVAASPDTPSLKHNSEMGHLEF